MLLSKVVSALALAGVSQAQKPYPITGAPTPNGVPLRQNINDLQNAGGPTWDLYVQALSKMYSVTDSDPLGFFQIAGIHGQPYVEWNKTGGRQGDGWLGYCPHGEQIFVTWHRPYVLLFEQILVKTALDIAATYPSQYRAQYTTAAQNLRAPFWDWGASATVPPSTVPLTLRINVPNGNALRQADVTNPLQSYTFPQVALNGKYGSFQPGSPKTVRCPAPKSYPNSANQNLAARPYKQWVYDTMTQSTSFIDFASTSGDGINLESIHNAIHWDGACAQQFLAPDFSAYDPLFFLHHSNVDRLWAYWEAIQGSQAVFTNSYQGQSRWGVRSGTTITNRSPLLPFFDSNANILTSYGVVPLSDFGYSYKGMEYWAKTPAQMKSDVTTIINQLYRTSSRRRAVATTEQRYFVKLSVNVTDLAIRPCEVNVFVGGNKAGSMVVMKLPAEGTVNGGFSVDDAIKALQSSSKSAARNAATSFQDYVTVSINTVDGTDVPIANIPSLTFQLETVNVTMPASDDQLPKYGQRQRHGAYQAARRPHGPGGKKQRVP
ncbi:Tyrosinase [Cladobotryum mycophilum]|uniref:tyrosinase n=1 Tax=Cladobotryum mycophilum TaxID=491253 RepID=A0ABR0S857_9HYPO